VEYVPQQASVDSDQKCLDHAMHNLSVHIDFLVLNPCLYNISPVSECDQDIGESPLFRPALAGGCFEMSAIRHCALSKLIAESTLNLMFGYVLRDHRRRNTEPRSSQSFARHAQLLVSFRIKQEVTRASGPCLPSTRAGSPAKSSNGLPIFRTFYQDAAPVNRRGCVLGMHRATDSKHLNYQ
jgi:hypothetical protein